MRLITMNGAVLNRPATATLGPGGIATTNVKLWLKTDALGLSNGTAISSFTDSGPLGNHAVQASGTLQPVYTTGGQNGLPYAQFDTSDDDLRCASISSTDTAAIMVITVFASPPTGDDGIIYEMTDGDAGTVAGCVQAYRRSDDFIRLQLRGNGGAGAIPQLVMNDAALTSTPTYTTTTYDFSQAAGSEIAFRRNGVDKTSAGVVVNGGTNNTDTAFAAQPLHIGNRGGGGLASGIRLYEFIILKGTDTTERNTVEAYLASKYGL